LLRFLERKRMENKENCCQVKEKKTAGFLSGLLSGLLPHSFCIAFIILTAIGATALTGLLKSVLLVPFFFQILIGLSLFLASVSALVYLWKNSLLSFTGIKKKWRYLLVLYGMTVGMNLLMFAVVLPRMANIGPIGQPKILSERNTTSIVLVVEIPCPGHAQLIIDELKKSPGVNNVVFKSPNFFEVNFDPQKFSLSGLLSLEIFKTFKVTINPQIDIKGSGNVGDFNQCQVEGLGE